MRDVKRLMRGPVWLVPVRHGRLRSAGAGKEDFVDSRQAPFGFSRQLYSRPVRQGLNLQLLLGLTTPDRYPLRSQDLLFKMLPEL